MESQLATLLVQRDGPDLGTILYLALFLLPVLLRFVRVIVSEVAKVFGIELPKLKEPEEPSPSSGELATESRIPERTTLEPEPLPRQKTPSAAASVFDEVKRSVELPKPKAQPVPKKGRGVGRDKEVSAKAGPREIRPSKDRESLVDLLASRSSEEKKEVPFASLSTEGASLSSSLELQSQERFGSKRSLTNTNRRLQPEGEGAAPLPRSLADWQRAFVMQEIIAPPIALRPDHRAGELPSFDLV